MGRKISAVKKFIIFLGIPLIALCSCSEVPYMAHCVSGQIQLLSKRTPIEKVLSDPDTSPELKRQLSNSLAIRDFASRELSLPENGSYRSYADLGRPYVVWNVVATPEFSLVPLQWCFPFAGCVSYRGYFKPEKARNFAEGLKEQGKDVYLYGVTAYSTLSWFDDPVLNTFCNASAPNLAGLIFHELAHQVVYVKNDSAFNEAFAKTTELEGVRRWLETNGSEKEKSDYLLRLKREDDFLALIRGTKNSLERLYESSLPEETLRVEKGQIFEDLRSGYQKLKESWGGYSGYDRWFGDSLNNAKLASINTYRQYVPAFEELLSECKGNLPLFYEKSRQIGSLSMDQRKEKMEALLKARQKSSPIAQSEPPGPEKHNP